MKQSARLLLVVGTSLGLLWLLWGMNETPSQPPDLEVVASPDTDSTGTEPPSLTESGSSGNAAVDMPSPNSPTGVSDSTSNDNGIAQTDDITALSGNRASNSQRGSQPASAESETTESPRPVLRPRVFAVIEEIQTHQLAGHWEAALNELNALYTEIDDLSTFEQSTLLNFYTNTLLRLEMYNETIVAFEQILQLQDINAATESRAKRALGDLYAMQGNPDASVLYLTEWLEKFGNEERVAPSAQAALLQLAKSHNTLGNYTAGIAALETHIAMRVNANQEVPDETYALLHDMTAIAGSSVTQSIQ